MKKRVQFKLNKERVCYEKEKHDKIVLKHVKK
jgi:hypothetical protein